MQSPLAGSSGSNNNNNNNSHIATGRMTAASSASSSSLSNNHHKMVSYESYAPRSTEQVSRLSRIAALTAAKSSQQQSLSAQSQQSTHSRVWMESMSVPSMQQQPPQPQSSSHSFTTTSTTTDEEEKQADHPDDAVAVADDNNLVVIQQALSRSSACALALQQQWKHTTSLRLALRASLNIGQDVLDSHAALIRHSADLSAQADLLSEQAESLEHDAEELGRPLQHYNAVDRLGPQVGVIFHAASGQQARGLAKLQVDADEFPTVLQQIDDAILYFGQEAGGPAAWQELQQQQQTSGGKSAAGQPRSGNLEYYRRALVLQEAALALIQHAVADRIQLTTTQIQNALVGQVVPADQLEASLIYTRFHGIASRSQRLLQLVQTRLQALASSSNNRDDATAAYYELRQTCRTTWCTCRETLLAPTVQAHLEQLDQLHGPTGMTRLASVFLMRTCQVETALFGDFFVATNATAAATETSSASNKNNNNNKTANNKKSSTTAGLSKNAELQAYLQSLCSHLHRMVRRSLVRLTDLDTLCQIVAVLREEGEQAGQQAHTHAAAKTMDHLTQDAQERLIFCAHRTLQKQVIRFKALPKDLDYPQKLVQLKEIQMQQQQQPPPASPSTNKEGDEDDDAEETSAPAPPPRPSLDAQEQLNLVYESWFPPMRTVLRILSKIFRVVETRVFEDMALSSVQACTNALKEGANFIRTAKSPRDADLFLVKHLLILREQLSPFDMELRTVERQLDFSDAGKAVAKFLANRNRRLLSMSTENAVLTLLREGVTVQESSVDSKRDLEEALRSACNDFIEHAVQSMAGSLVTFVSERSGSTKLSNKDGPALVETILKETVEQTNVHLPVLLEKMALYLDNPATQNILLKPVTKKILKSTEEVKKWISNTVDHNWNGEARTQALELAQQIEPAIKKWTAKK